MRKPKQANLERYHANALWFGDHYEELKALYPDLWVGIRDKKVAGAHENPEQLMIELKSKGISLETMFFDFVSTKDEIWVFVSVA